MALASPQRHSIHPLGKHGTSLHGSVACRSLQDMVLDSWIQEDKSDWLDMELPRGRLWALGSGPWWHSNTCSSEYRSILSLFQDGEEDPLQNTLPYKEYINVFTILLPWAAGSCGSPLSRAIAVVSPRARQALLQTAAAFAARPSARRAL